MALGLILGAGLAAALPALDSDPRWRDAVRLIGEGRCVAALPLLAELRAERPGDAEVALAAGRCELRLRRYPEAVAALEEARALAPARAGVSLPLAIARFHRGDPAGAEQALADAAAEGADTAEFHLYRGLLLQRAGDPRAAAAELALARGRDAAAVEPVASYHEGLAWEAAGERGRAEQALRRVAEGPAGPWLEPARRALERVRRGGPRAWAAADVGLEYDDNAVLLGRGVELPAEISDQRDGRLVWSLAAGADLVRRSLWTGAAQLRYDGVEYDDLSEFDSHFPTLSAWLDRRLGADHVARFELDAGYAWVDAEPFVALARSGVSLFRRGPGRGTTRLYARYGRYDYLFGEEDVPDGPGTPGAPCRDPDTILCGPPGIDEERERDRDGGEALAGLEHALPLGLRDFAAWGGYEFARFAADGSEYSFDSHALLGGLRGSLPGRLRLELWASHAWRDYRHPSTFPAPEALVANRQYGLSDSDRSERDLEVGAALLRPLGERLSVEARWQYARNRSNVDVFDYRRHVVGLHLHAALGR